MVNLDIQVKPDFDIDEPHSIAINTITIESETLYHRIVSQHSNIPMVEIRRQASIKLAEYLIDKLKYDITKDERYNSTIYTFSIYNYTTLEKDKLERIIKELNSKIADLSSFNCELRYRRVALENIISYNSRSLFTKLKEWLLLGRPFNKGLR